MRFRRALPFLAVAAVAAVASASLIQQRVSVNGVASDKPILVQNGERYVALSALQAGGATVQEVGGGVSIRFTPMGGMTQVDAIEGVKGEWLNNGLVRVRATNPRQEGATFRVDLEVANLAKNPINPEINLGMGFPELYGEGGKIERAALGNADFSKSIGARLTQGSAGKATLTYNGNPGKGAKLLIRFTMNAARERVVAANGGFRKPGPNFRIALD